MATTVNFDNLFDVKYPMTEQFHTLKLGEVLVRGQAVAKETSGDKLVAYTLAGVAGAPFFGISPDDYDATDAAIDGVKCITGCRVNKTEVVFGASGDTATQAFVEAARLKGVHVVAFISGAVATVA